MLKGETKRLVWVGRSMDDVRAFPADARQRAGYELCGLDPSYWKPMPTVGSAVREIRIHTKTGHRVIYIAKFAEGVYVLHAFQKTTRQTRRVDIDVASARLPHVITMRRREHVQED
jgi:phage-related protein